MKVVIIGSGNVATVIGKKIANTKHEITQIVGRNKEKVINLSSYLKATYTFNILNINKTSDIYIIAVSDNSITQVAANLKLIDKVIVHTAGAIPKIILADSSENYGVLYPLQSLISESSHLPSIPILIDGNNEITKQKLWEFASEWADNLLYANDDERLQLHIAAVFVNNFTNHFYIMAQDYCSKNNLNFNFLYPLIEETIVRIKTMSPSKTQTGPALRNDFETIAKHQKMLEKDPEMLKLYNMLSDSIIKFYSKNK